MKDPHPDTAQWLRRSIVATGIIGVVTVLYCYNLRTLLHLFDGFYRSRNEPAAAGREYLLQIRVHNYSYFLVAAFFALAVWTLSLRFSSQITRIGTRLSLLQHRTARLLIAGVCLGLVIAVAILFSNREWVRFGRPCWDNYCLYTDLVFRWLSVRTPEALDSLVHFMRSDYHANSPLGPFLFALVKMATGWKAVTTIGAASILWLCLIKPARLGPFVEGALLILFGTNAVVVRCFLFPQTDALVLLWTAALMAVALRRISHRRLAYDVGACFLLTTGLFVKLSFLPWLALIPLWRILDGLLKGVFGSREGLKRWVPLFTKELLLFSVVPLICYLAFQRGLGLMNLFFVELHAMRTPDTFFPFKVISLLHAALFFMILILWGRRRLEESDYFLLAGAGLYLFSLLVSNTAGWDRFYLPLVPPLCVVAGRGLVVVQEKGGAGLVGIFVLLVAFLNYSLLKFWLFY
jgi:hypothetical protein